MALTSLMNTYSHLFSFFTRIHLHRIILSQKQNIVKFEHFQRLYPSQHFGAEKQIFENHIFEDGFYLQTPMLIKNNCFTPCVTINFYTTQRKR